MADTTPPATAAPGWPTLAASFDGAASVVDVLERADDTVSASSNARTVTNAYEIQMAYGRIRQYLRATQLTRAPSTLCPGFRVWVKHEYAFRTGSFKERGALNALLLLTPEERRRGVIAASAGNHAQALAYHGRHLGVPVTVYMPVIAPLTKVQQCLNFGAHVEISGENLNVSREAAIKVAAERGLTYVHGFNDPAVINGAGSCGIEIMEQLPDVEAVVVCTGGGGFIAGVSMAVKQRNPHVKIIAVQSVSCPSFAEAHAAGKPVKVVAKPTLADGTAVPMVGDHAFAVAHPLIDEYVVVEEKWICLAVVRVIEVEKVTLEGAGALGVAALLSGKLDHLKGLKTVVIFSGGNIDITTLGRVIERGLLVDQRLIRVRAHVSDNPGGLFEFLRHVANLGCSVKDIYQERGYTTSKAVWVRTAIETRGAGHTAELLTSLRAAGYDIQQELDPHSEHDPPVPQYYGPSPARSAAQAGLEARPNTAGGDSTSRAASPAAAAFPVPSSAAAAAPAHAS
jgi:threonine dehydratase